MQRSSFRSADDLLSRTSLTITQWVLGIGFLSLHASVFFVSLVGLLLWNLYDAPNDLWALDVVRRWGTLLALHALAVAAGWGAWKLLRAEQRAIDSNAAGGWSGQTANVRALNGTAVPPQWPQTPPATLFDRYRTSANQADDAARRFAHSTVLWSAKVASGTRTAMSQARTKLGAKPAEATGATHDPTLTWPAPVQHRSEDDEFIARFGHANGNGHSGPGPVVQPAPASQPLSSPPSHGNGNTGFAKDPGWTWVETAAASWTTRREREEHARPEQNGAATPAPGPMPPEAKPDGPAGASPA